MFQEVANYAVVTTCTELVKFTEPGIEGHSDVSLQTNEGGARTLSIISAK